MVGTPINLVQGLIRLGLITLLRPNLAITAKEIKCWHNSSQVGDVLLV